MCKFRILRSLLFLILIPLGASASEKDPVLHEEVGVKLMMVDVRVFSPSGKLVDDLDRDDFLISIDGKKVKTYIEVNGEKVENYTFDNHCPSQRDEKSNAAAYREPFRAVLMFDEHHLPHSIREQTIEAVQELVGQDENKETEFMVARIGGRYEILQSFTSDTDAVLDALERMKEDPPATDRHPLSHKYVFEHLESMLMVMEQIKGNKSLLFISTMLANKKMSFDPDYRRISAEAASARTTIYTMHAGGLTADDPKTFGCSSCRRALWAPALRDLASTTGGVYFSKQTVFKKAFADIQEAHECRYTFGFYQRRLKDQKIYDVNIQTKKLGRSILHAGAYRFRSPEKKEERLIGAAFRSPDTFDDGRVKAEIIPIKPYGRNGWQTLLAIEIPMEVLSLDKNKTSTFGAVLYRGSHIVHTFSRQAIAKKEGVRSYVFIEPILKKLNREKYQASVVLYEEETGKVKGTVSAKEIFFSPPEIPAKGPFATAPLPRRTKGKDWVVFSGLFSQYRGYSSKGWVSSGDIMGDEQATVPIFDRIVDPEEMDPQYPFVYFPSTFCGSPRDISWTDARIRNVDTDEDVIDFEESVLDVERAESFGGQVQCQDRHDELWISPLTPGRYEYVLSVYKKKKRKDILVEEKTTVFDVLGDSLVSQDQN